MIRARAHTIKLQKFELKSSVDVKRLKTDEDRILNDENEKEEEDLSIFEIIKLNNLFPANVAQSSICFVLDFIWPTNEQNEQQRKRHKNKF